MLVVTEYQQIFVRGTGGTPSFTTMEGFLSAKVLVEGLRRAGPQLTREKLMAAMDGMQDYDLGSYTVSYSPTSRGSSKYVDITVIGGGGKVLR
jgi:ABC-type branched-subunit amino acid transport system substrate-binding protein